jgi:hypothetical protein
MELGKVEFSPAVPEAPYPGFDADDVDLCRYHERIGIEGVK